MTLTLIQHSLIANCEKNWWDSDIVALLHFHRWCQRCWTEGIYDIGDCGKAKVKIWMHAHNTVYRVNACSKMYKNGYLADSLFMLIIPTKSKTQNLAALSNLALPLC